jgi:hypothetical protein
MAKHRRRFEEEHQQLCELQAEYKRAISELAAWQRTQNDRLSSVGGSLTEFQLSVDRRLSLVESNSAAKSDLAKCALKSDLEANYATKSHLQTNCATKSDFGKCALKSDFSLNCATKSDLHSNYLTKSEANSLEQRYASKADLEKQLNSLKRVIGWFPLIPDSPRKGVIHHLTLECGGNVHDREVNEVDVDEP